MVSKMNSGVKISPPVLFRSLNDLCLCICMKKNICLKKY